MSDGHEQVPEDGQDVPPSGDRGPADSLTVVGIGASAGGLGALRQFFATVPADSGLAYVVVVHLAPDHPSHLADILRPHLKMPVEQVTETVRLEPNRVFIIPPNANLDAIDTHLRLSKLEVERRARAPIDHFFRTLAKIHDGHAVGVILSGSGSDGALGIREINARGGLTVVQSPSEAEYDGMPQSAVATGAVDFTLPIAEIYAAVARFAHTRPHIPEVSAGAAAVEPAEAEEVEQQLRRIFTQVRARTGRDFSRYKHSTILRRIARRMQLRQLEQMGDYIELLRREPAEVSALADEILITVTSFFRDRAVFETLERSVIPKIFARKGVDDEIRIWTVGCASGEEAYSIAMLFLEEAARQEVSPRLQVFASDLHEPSLGRAREGFYPGDIETDVSAERLRRFFQKENGSYRVRKEVRDRVVFAQHNLLGDPPFSRIDLISCRNLLIYLRREAQRDVTELFHYALRPGGYLVLGSSESVDGGALFLPEDKKNCVFRRQDVPTPEPRLPVFPATSGRDGATRAGFTPSHRPAGERIRVGDLHARMAERYAPPSVLVSPDEEVVHVSEHAGRYLVHPGGELTANVYKMVREELLVELRAALADAHRGNATRSRPIAVRFGGETRSVVLQVRPSMDPEQPGFALVIFDERAESAEEQGALGTTPATHATPGERENELKLEVESLRERLQALIEEHETSQEEMKAANEELQSANEELRSTMEELETSKEELHSMNEELHTVNQENRHKVEELAQLTGDLQNFLGATKIPTLFLDRDLRIMRFTPQVEELFSIRPADRGRSLADFTHRLAYDDLQRDAAAVLDRLAPLEREVRDHAGRWHLARVMPYLSSDDRIAGVVITLIDITQRKQNEEALRASEERLAAELRALRRLHELVSRLYVTRDVLAALDEVLAATVEIAGASMGNVQLYDPARRSLRLIAHLGFTGEFVDHFREVQVDDQTALCARAAVAGERLIVEDVEKDELLMKHREAVEAAGYRAVQSTPLLSREGALLGVLSTHYREPTRPSERDLQMLDLYARQAAEFLEHVQSREALEEADQRKDEFLAMLGHELRNPLGAMTNAILLLRRENGAEDRRALLLDALERQERQLSRLVDDLLDVARITQGKIQLRGEVVDLRPLVQEAVEMHRQQIEHKEQKLALSLPDDGIVAEADPTRLVQIVGNLVHNASKFSPAHSRIDVRLARDEGDVVIEIADQGLGLASGEAERIFELFAQGDRTLARTEGGLGVGLTMVKRLVELHHGSISVESPGRGKGSLFRVRLPSTSKRPEARDRGAGARGVSPRRRVLVVDDNADAGEMLCELLRGLGHQCWMAADGKEGLSRFLEHEPEVVLLDIGLPGMDGFEVATEIRRQPRGREVLLIALTGYGQDEIVERARANGFDHHLLKPADPELIQRLLAEGRPATGPPAE